MLCGRRGRRESANSDLLGDDYALRHCDMLAASASLAIIYARCDGDDEVSCGVPQQVCCGTRSGMLSKQMSLLFALPGCS